LYKRRRKPDTMEIQQMKALAKEEKLRRQVWQAKNVPKTFYAYYIQLYKYTQPVTINY